MRPAGIALVATTAVVGLVGVLPALAADQTVDARDNYFDPPTARVNPDDTVTFEHAGSNAHSLQFADEDSERVGAGTGWRTTRTFTAVGTYRFFCNEHDGMAGRVVVEPRPSPTPTVSTTPTATATSSATPTPGPGTDPPPPGGDPGDPGGPGPTARLLSLELRSSRPCMRKGPRCRVPGVSVEIELSAPAQVTGRITRRRDGRFRRFGTVDFGVVPAGEQRLTFRKSDAGRRLTRGRYRLRLSVAGAKRRLAFRVRASR